MTAAHRLPGAILTPRCRGARAVASFNAAEAGSSPAVERIVCRHRKPLRQMTHEAPVRRQLITSAERASRSSARPAAPFNGRNAQVDARGEVETGSITVLPDGPVTARASRAGEGGSSPHSHTREIDARPSAISNAASNERSPEPGRCLVSSEAPGCRGDAYTQPSPCEMTTHCMAKANAGDGGRHGCTQHSDRQRPARFAAAPCRLPRPFSSL